jgi:hypothetical protein
MPPRKLKQTEPFVYHFLLINYLITLNINVRHNCSDTGCRVLRITVFETGSVSNSDSVIFLGMEFESQTILCKAIMGSRWKWQHGRVYRKKMLPLDQGRSRMDQEGTEYVASSVEASGSEE